MLLATSVIQMPAITSVKPTPILRSITSVKPASILRSDLVLIPLRKPKTNCRAPTKHFCCKSELADFAPLTSATYGILLFSGGLFAFNKSGSKGSLFGGLTGAALMTSAYFLMQSSETKAIGDALGFGSAFLFSSVFGIRLAATRKPIPAVPLLGLSLCVLAVFTSAYLQDRL